MLTKNLLVIFTFIILISNTYSFTPSFQDVTTSVINTAPSVNSHFWAGMPDVNQDGCLDLFIGTHSDYNTNDLSLNPSTMFMQQKSGGVCDTDNFDYLNVNTARYTQANRPNRITGRYQFGNWIGHPEGLWSFWGTDVDGPLGVIYPMSNSVSRGGTPYFDNKYSVCGSESRCLPIDTDGDGNLELINSDNKADDGVRYTREIIDFQTDIITYPRVTNVFEAAYLVFDINQDSYPDLLGTESDGAWIYNPSTENYVWNSNYFPNPASQANHNSIIDYDSDGDMDVLTASGSWESDGTWTFYLFENQNGNLVDVSSSTGINALGLNNYQYWSIYGNTVIADLDLDGYPDIIMSGEERGNAVTLIKNDGDGTFSVDDSYNFRGSYAEDGTQRPWVNFGDYDNDGRIDLVKTHIDSGSNHRSIGLFRNTIDVGNNKWMRVRVRGLGDNTDGLHTKLIWKVPNTNTVITSTEINVQQSGSYLIPHVGLGTNNLVDLEVIYPHNGPTYLHEDLAVDQDVIVFRDGGIIEGYQPGTPIPLTSAGANYNCGNNVIESPEICDGNAAITQTCQGLGYDGGTLSCASNSCFSYDTSACTSTGPVCGNNIIESGETCDGSSLNGQSCTTQGFDSGSLSCLSDCSGYDTSSCQNDEPTDPGNGGGNSGGDITGTNPDNTQYSLILTATASCSEGYDPHWQCGGNWLDVDTVGSGQYIATCPEGQDLSDCLAADRYKLFEDITSNEGVFVCPLSSAENGGRNSCAGSMIFVIASDIFLFGNGSTGGPTQTCSNNIREGTEVCDGSDLNSQTCQTQGFSLGGILGCSNSCDSFDTSGCTADPGDTTAPSISGGSPSGSLPSITTNVNLRVYTDETSICRYSNSDVPFASMSLFSSTNDQVHSITVNLPTIGGGSQDLNTPTDLDTTVVLKADSYITPNSNELVTFGLPFPEGLITNLDDIRVLINNVEQQVYIEEGLTWWSDNSIRSATIQFQGLDMTNGDITVRVTDDGSTSSRLGSKTPVLNGWANMKGSSKSNTLSPRILPMHDPTYLAVSGLIPPYSPDPVTADAYKDYRDSMFFDWRADANFGTSTGAHWQFDMPSSHFKGYMSSGDVRYLAEAARAKQFYFSHVRNDGITPAPAGGDGCWTYGVACADGKYIYPQPAKLSLGLLGDDSQWDDSLINDMGEQAQLGWNQWWFDFPHNRENDGYTERTHGIIGLAIVNAYEITGDSGLLNDLKDGIDYSRDMQQTVFQWDADNNWGNIGCFRHSWAIHEGGYSSYPGDGVADDRRCSPWMSSLVADFLWQAYWGVGNQLSNRNDIPEILRFLGESIEAYAYDDSTLAPNAPQVGIQAACGAGCTTMAFCTEGNTPVPFYSISDVASQSALLNTAVANGRTDTHIPEMVLIHAAARYFETDQTIINAHDARISRINPGYYTQACADWYPNTGVQRLYNWQLKANPQRTWDWVESGGTYTGGGSAEGNHKYYVRCQDASGNINSQSYEIDFEVGGTPTQINGVCSSSLNSCQSGTLTDITDSNENYLWNCVGTNGGSTDSCSLPKPVNGVCGTILNSCTSGTLNDIADTSTDYLWNCVGTNGGTTDSCSQTIPPVDLCGNGVLNPGEECDGDSYGSQTCSTLGFETGTLSCSNSCEIISNACGYTTPQITINEPSNNLSFGSTSGYLELTTNEETVCKYSRGIISFDDMITLTASNNGQTHSITIPFFDSSNTQSYNIICRDNYNQDANEFITFSISGPPENDPPIIILSNPLEGEVLDFGTTSTNIILTTDEESSCKYSDMEGTSFDSMQNSFASSNQDRIHTISDFTLMDDTTYLFHVKCRDIYENTNPNDFTFNFSVGTDDSPIFMPEVNLTEILSMSPLGVIDVGLASIDVEVQTRYYSICRLSDSYMDSHADYTLADMTINSSTNMSSAVLDSTLFNRNENITLFVSCIPSLDYISNNTIANFTFSLGELDNDTNSTEPPVVEPPEDTGSSSGGGGGGGSSSRNNDRLSILQDDVCKPDYTYPRWSTCLDGIQERTITDDNGCEDPKTESRICKVKNNELENKFLNVKELIIEKFKDRKRTYKTTLSASYNEIISSKEKLDDESFVLVDEESGEEYLGRLVEETEDQYFYSLERIDENLIGELKAEGLVDTTTAENLDKGFKEVLSSTYFKLGLFVFSIILIVAFIYFILIYVRRLHN